MKLTDKTLAALKPKTTLFKVTDDRCPGLTLRIHPGGTKSWYIRKTIELEGTKQRVELKIGKFPAMNCTQARGEFHQQTAVIDDALSHAVSAARSRVTRLTLGELLEKYLDYVEPGIGAGTFKTYKASASEGHRIARGVMPIQMMQCSRLTRNVCKGWLRTMLAAGYKKNTLNNAVWLYGAAVAWGVDEGLIEVPNHFPSLKRRDLKRVRATPKRCRVLSDVELQFCWDFYAFGSNPARSFETQTVMRLLMLTGLRRAEVMRLHWADVGAGSQHVVGLGDKAFDLLIVPEERTKTHAAYAVPIFGPIREVLDQYAARVQPSGGQLHSCTCAENPQKCLGLMFPETAARKSLNGILSALHTRGATHTLHDIRRTVATRMSAAGVPRESVEAVLQHTTKGNASDHYIHHEFIGQKVKALAAWFALLGPIVNDGPPVLVLPAPVDELVA